MSYGFLKATRPTMNKEKFEQLARAALWDRYARRPGVDPFINSSTTDIEFLYPEETVRVFFNSCADPEACGWREFGFKVVYLLITKYIVKLLETGSVPDLAAKVSADANHEL